MTRNRMDIYGSGPQEENPIMYKYQKRKQRKQTKGSVKLNDISPNKEITEEQSESKNSSPNVKSPEGKDKGGERAELPYEPIRGKNGNKKLPSIVEESPKQIPESPIRQHNYNVPDAPDAYIHQLVSKKNPILKQPNVNMLRIANIYSGNNADHVISMHKR